MASNPYSMFSPQAQQIMRSPSYQQSKNMSNVQFNYSMNQRPTQTSFTKSVNPINPGVQGVNNYSNTPTSSTNPTPQAPSPYYDPGTGRTFDSYGSYENEVNNAYSGLENLINQTEANTRAGEQDLYTSATKPYDALTPILDQAKQEGLNLNMQQQETARQDETNAITAARRLYQELTQGARQRFGGASSAGQFANSLMGRQFQQNVGQAQTTAGQNIQNLMSKAQDINKQHTAQMQQITMQREAALAQARDEFRRRIDQINNSRIGLAENKAQMKLAELQNLRANIQGIQNNFITMQQQLQANIANMAAQSAANIQGYRAQAGQPVDLAQIGRAAYSTFGQGQPQMQLPNITGYYNPEDRKRLGIG